jgi:alpha-tubulin suppressor-like RCC1 family protein
MTGIQAIEVGSGFTCALLEQGYDVRCVGDDKYGTLGNGDPLFQSLALERVISLYTRVPTLQPTNQPSLSQLTPKKTFSTGTNHAVSIQSDGTAFSWGANSRGQLGHNMTSSHVAIATSMVGITNASDVSAGHYCTILVQNGGVWSVGWRAKGQLGDGMLISC